MGMKRSLGVTVALACAVFLAVYMFALPVEAAQIESRFVGNYNGFFNGDADYGRFVVTIETSGNIYGTGWSSKTSTDMSFSGSCQPGGAFQFQTTDGSMIFTGTLDWMNRMDGRWSKADGSGQGSFGAVPGSWAK